MSVTVAARGAARVVTVDRPHRRNALDPDALAALRGAAVKLRRDRGARAVVLTGAQGVGVFLSGGDLQVLKDVRTAQAARAMAKAAHAAVDALHALGLPLVAAVHGDAYGGGCELAAACDYRVAEEGVRFHWVQARFAITTGWGGASNLLDLVPRGTAARWLLTAAPVPVAEAHAAGFVDAVVPSGAAVDEAVAFAERVAKHPRAGVARMLTLLRASSRLSRAGARALELKEFGASWATPEHHDAVAAFLARRG
ncbi:MAG: enoyl-CoA hydratase/isomerase family protein [Polyangiales bacterium]